MFKVKTDIYKTSEKPFILSEEDSENLQKKFLRIVNVIYIIFGRETLSDKMFNLITGTDYLS